MSAVEATVRDDEEPRLVARFGYVASAFAKHLLLRSVAIEPAPGMELGKQARLTIAGVRDLPLARWEAAARAHISQKLSMTLDEHRQLWGKLAGPAEADRILTFISPAVRVQQLYPGLAQSSTPGDMRRYKSLLRLAEVADEYQRAQRDGVHDPAAFVARNRGEKPATVRSWLHRARKAGLLDEHR